MSSIKDEDLPAQMKERQKVAHKIAEEAFKQVWNAAAVAGEKVNRSISGNEALSYFGTILADFAGRWIIQLDKIAKDHTAGVTTEEVIKNTINGILATIGAKATFEEENKVHPNGIKKLKKETA